MLLNALNIALIPSRLGQIYALSILIKLLPFGGGFVCTYQLLCQKFSLFKGDRTMNAELVDILIVDDNEDDVLLLEEAFKDAKLANSIHSVANGDEAIAYLRKVGRYKDVHEPGLVLLDINMPKKNGFEVLDEIKTDKSLCHIPIIMLTTSSRDEDIIKSYQKGACTFVRKPVAFDNLREMVKHFSYYWRIVAELPTVH